MNKTIDILDMVKRFKNPDEFYQYALIIGPKVGYVACPQNDHSTNKYYNNIGDHFKVYPSIKIIALLWYYALMYNNVFNLQYYKCFPFMCNDPKVVNQIQIEPIEDNDKELGYLTHEDFQMYITSTFSETVANEILNLSKKYVNEFVHEFLDMNNPVRFIITTKNV